MIQINYDAALAQSLFGGEAGLRLAWHDLANNRWLNAVLGNGGGTPKFFERAYNPATDFAVGNFGVDTANKVAWAVVNHNSEFAVMAVPDPLALKTAFSRKTHTGAGAFDIPLPLSGAVGVDPRRGTPNGDHQLVLTFSEPVTVGGASVTSGAGTVSSYTVNGGEVTVNLTGVADEQIVTIGLTNVSNGSATIAPSLSIGFLLGDGSGNGTVNSGDALATRSRSGQATDATNYQFDANCDGTINGGDATIVKARSGNTIYP